MDGGIDQIRTPIFPGAMGTWLTCPRGPSEITVLRTSLAVAFILVVAPAAGCRPQAVDRAAANVQPGLDAAPPPPPPPPPPAGPVPPPYPAGRPPPRR